MLNAQGIQAVRELYSDDMSKLIFDHRVRYAQSNGDSVHLLDMILTSLEGVEYSFDYNKQLIGLAKWVLQKTRSGHKCTIVFFGAGGGMITPLELMYEYRVIERNALNASMVEMLICDNNPQLWDTVSNAANPLKRIRIISPNELQKHKNDENCRVVVTVNSLHSKNAVYNQLISFRFKKEQIICEPSFCEYFLGRIYFPPDIMKSIGGEMFVDCGAFDMGNSLDFSRWCNGDYSKIIAFEADGQNYQTCLKVIEDYNLRDAVIHNRAVTDKECEISFAVAPGGEHGGSRIDAQGNTVVKGDPIDNYLTLEEKGKIIIKMDIEGAEADALRGSANIIKLHKPRLALSAYHRRWDVVELPQLILALNPHYEKFYLRHHTLGPWDTVLYAI